MFGSKKATGQRSKYLEKLTGALKDKEDSQKEISGTEDTHGKKEGKTHRNQFLSWMETSLDTWSSELGEIDGKSRQFEPGFIEEHQERVRELERKIEKGREKMREITHATDHSWHNLKGTAETLLADISASLEKARENYQKEMEDE